VVEAIAAVETGAQSLLPGKWKTALRLSAGQASGAKSALDSAAKVASKLAPTVQKLLRRGDAGLNRMPDRQDAGLYRVLLREHAGFESHAARHAGSKHMRLRQAG
jgi:hypothetical protein